MTIFVELLGSLAGFCTTHAFLPQVIKVIKTRSVNDISILMYIIFCSGLILWIIYGIYLNSIPLILANVVTLALASAILAMKVLWDSKISN